MATRFDDWEGDALQHYGVLGMKWGHHKNPEKAFNKAISKKNKLDMYVAKKHVKSAKIYKKLNNLENSKRKMEFERDRPGRGAESRAILQKLVDKDAKRIETFRAKSTKAEASYAKANLKAAKWTNTMMKTFGTTSYSAFKETNQSTIDKGKSYTKVLLKPSKRAK